jgi:hypothetical protein
MNFLTKYHTFHLIYTCFEQVYINTVEIKSLQNILADNFEKNISVMSIKNVCLSSADCMAE